MSGTPKHTPRQPLHELHRRQKGSADGGACITGHHVRYAANSCSYRWQAREISLLMRRPVYDGKVGSTPITTMAIKDKNGEIFPPRYVEVLDPPRFGDWDLDGPRRTITRGIDAIPPQKNFTKNRWPYWNDAHHLIPKGIFEDVIASTGKGRANPETPDIIRTKLLSTGYNINHGRNVVLLPQDAEVGKLLGLPRHLILIERSQDASQITRAEMQSHGSYDKHVAIELRKIINRMRKSLANDPCGAKPVLTNEHLDRLSRSLYEMIVYFGTQNAGAPVADSPSVTKKPMPTKKSSASWETM